MLPLKKVRLLQILKAFALLFAVFAGFSLLSWPATVFNPNPFDDMKFNRSDWLEDRMCVDSGNRRARMAYDILAKHIKIGMTRSQIVSVLGDPEKPLMSDPTSQESMIFHAPENLPVIPADMNKSHIMVYYLGEELAFFRLPMIDRAWLYLYLDTNGHYIGNRIFTP